MRLLRPLTLTTTLLALLAPGASARADEHVVRPILDALNMDENGWVWDDLAKAKEIARKQRKPLFVVFRCVP